MKTSSAKAKGRRACAEVKELILRYGAEFFSDGDIEVTSSGAPGRDLKLSPLALHFFPFAIEVKNVEKLNVREGYTQAISHQRPGEIPILFHTRNRDKMLVTVAAEDFLLLARAWATLERDGGRLVKTHDPGLQVQCEEKAA